MLCPLSTPPHSGCYTFGLCGESNPSQEMKQFRLFSSSLRRRSEYFTSGRQWKSDRFDVPFTSTWPSSSDERHSLLFLRTGGSFSSRRERRIRRRRRRRRRLQQQMTRPLSRGGRAGALVISECPAEDAGAGGAEAGAKRRGGGVKRAASSREGK